MNIRSVHKMEQQVEDHASKLMSDEGHIVTGAFASISGAFRRESHSSASAKIKYARFLQEILAYKRGAAVQKLFSQALLTKTLVLSGTADERTLYVCSSVALAALSESRVIARYCLTNEEKARKLAQKLLEIHTFCLRFYTRDLQRTGEKRCYFFVTFALQIFKSFVNFARVSKCMRCCLLDLDGLFPALEQLLTDDFVELAEVDDGKMAMHYVHQMLATFISFEDSKQRALDKGLIQIHASVYSRMSKIVEKDGAKEDLAEFARKEAMAKKVAEADRHSRDSQDALTARRVQARYLEAIKEMLAEWEKRHAGTPLKEGLKAGLKSPKSWADWASGQDVDTPIVCSWELCELGSTVDEGRRFGKCSNCSLAFYCR